MPRGARNVVPGRVTSPCAGPAEAGSPPRLRAGILRRVRNGSMDRQREHPAGNRPGGRVGRSA